MRYGRFAFLASAAGVLYSVRLPQPILTWGASAEEAAQRLPGDELLEDADGVSTRAIDIQAPVQAVWPWLAQMGRRPQTVSATSGSLQLRLWLSCLCVIGLYGSSDGFGFRPRPWFGLQQALEVPPDASLLPAAERSNDSRHQPQKAARLHVPRPSHPRACGSRFEGDGTDGVHHRRVSCGSQPPRSIETGELDGHRHRPPPSLELCAKPRPQADRLIRDQLGNNHPRVVTRLVALVRDEVEHILGRSLNDDLAFHPRHLDLMLVVARENHPAARVLCRHPREQD
jgi:hypothetical protein